MFQLFISSAVILYAGLPVNTGSVSSVIPPPPVPLFHLSMSSCVIAFTCSGTVGSVSVTTPPVLLFHLSISSWVKFLIKSGTVGSSSFIVILPVPVRLFIKSQL